MKRIISSAVALIICQLMYGQEPVPRPDQIVEEVIESMIEQEESSAESSVDVEDIQGLAEHPIHINTATENELKQLYLLDFQKINQLLEYRKTYGAIRSPYELYSLEGWSPTLINQLMPFVSFELQGDSARLFDDRRFRQRLILRTKRSFPESAGYHSPDGIKPPAYPGSPWSYLMKYKAELSRNFVVGFTADNDAGEPFFSYPNNRGFDFYSGYLSFKSSKLISQICVGDFHLRFGQGLSYWSGNGAGFTSDALSIMRSGQGLRGYSSTDENHFFRGAAVVLAKSPAWLTLFYSNKNRDANISNDDFGNTIITSLQTSGYHRTASEWADKHSVNEQNWGLYGELRFSKIRLGVLASWQLFDLPMDKGESLYKQKSFSGAENFNFGFDYQWAHKKLQLFGEAGLSKSGKPAFLQGAVWRLHPQIGLSALYRNFDPAFHTFYGNAFSRSSGNRNERGFYTGLEILPAKKVRITASADLFHFPWVTYTTTAPGSGSDLMVQIFYSLSRHWQLSARLKMSSKPRKIVGDEAVPDDQEELINRLRLHSDLRLSSKFLLRNRLEYVDYSFNLRKEYGYLLYQDIQFTPNAKFNIWLRYARFRTDGYNSRVYAYENDLLYYYSVPALYGEGSRVYANLRWVPYNWLTLYLKTGITIKGKELSMGSGNDESAGNKRTELRLQLYLRL